jgi:hypothetical protein
MTSEPVRKIPTLPEGEETIDVTVPFAGAALQTIQQLQDQLDGVNDLRDVLLKGVALLAQAQGKQVLLKDRVGNLTTVRIWKAYGIYYIMVVNAEIQRTLPTLPEQIAARAKSEDLARGRIAILVVSVYLLLVTLNVIIPITLYLISKPTQALSISELREISLVVSTAISSVLGILGFVLGYYFKASEDLKQSTNTSFPVSTP